MMWDLDPRVRKFVDETLGLPEWELTNGLAEKGEYGVKLLIDQTIKKLNDAMGDTVSALATIVAQAVKETKDHSEGGWPYPTLGGGTWFGSPVGRYSEAVTKTYELRMLVSELVAAARQSGVIPKYLADEKASS